MKEFDYSDENIENVIATDYFSRNRYLVRLINVVNSLNECSAIAIDGKWGSGKTVFMHEFLYLLRQKETYNTLVPSSDENVDVDKIAGFYFNAWENDLINNPSLNILKSIIDQFSVFDTESRKKYEHCLDILKNVSIKVISGGTLESKDFKSGDNMMDTPVIDYLKKTFKDTIDAIKEVKKVDKIVIVIDELDRCRPNYAVELLENLKHFYENDDLIFIVSTDMEQLAHTVKGLYGSQFDADLYLQRFFSGIFTLNANNYEQYIINELGVNINNEEMLSEISKTTIKYYNLTVREINNFIRKLKISNIYEKINANTKTSEIISLSLFIPWGLSLKYSKSLIFNQFREGRMNLNDFSSFLLYDLETLKWFMKGLGIEYNEDDTDFTKGINAIYEMYQFIFSHNLFSDNFNDKMQFHIREFTKNYIKDTLDF